MDSVLSTVSNDMEANYRKKENLTLYKGEARFVDKHTVSVNSQLLLPERKELVSELTF